MATEAITTTLETHEWVLACNEYEQCEIEAINQDISFIQSTEIPPTDPKETNSMYFLKNVPREFSGDGSNKLWVFIDKKVILRKRPMTVPRTIAGYGDLAKDAWGHQKVVSDVSLFSSSFTFNVDRSLWIPFENGLEIYEDINLTKIGSLNGKLNMSSGAAIGNTAHIMSRRHARYQPNRGHLFSVSAFLPSKNAIGIRNFGIMNMFNGAYFSLEDGILYAVVRTTINSVTSETFKQAIDFDAVGLTGFELENGNNYDIQMQWRGVGDIRWFIANTELSVSVEVARYRHINTSAELSISNPSLPAWYECINTNGTDVTIQSGCVDVTTEGGTPANRSYASFPSGEVPLTVNETPVIAIRLPNMIFSTMNTRDIVLSQIDGYADADSLIRVYYFRDPAAITATFTPIREGFQEAAINGAITVFNIAQMIKLFETRIPATDSKEFINPDRGNADFYLTHGDYVLVTLQAKNNSLGGITLEGAVEI